MVSRHLLPFLNYLQLSLCFFFFFLRQGHSIQFKLVSNSTPMLSPWPPACLGLFFPHLEANICDLRSVGLWLVPQCYVWESFAQPYINISIFLLLPVIVILWWNLQWVISFDALHEWDLTFSFPYLKKQCHSYILHWSIIMS